jgi:hypothetical protein
MSELTVPTRMFLGLLTDLALTACDDPELPTLRAVLLHTDRGEWATDVADDEGSEPLIDVVPSDLLIGTSTDRHSVGQAHTPCEGSLHRPVLVSLADVKAVVSAFKPLVTSLGKEATHRVVLGLEGDTLTVVEDPTQVPRGLEVSFPTLDADNFPSVALYMQPDPTMPVPGPDGHTVIEPSYGTGLHPKYLEVFGKVGKRRGMPVAVYRHHQHRPVVVEIGSAYRVVVSPSKLDEDAGQQLGPVVRVFTPPAPQQLTAMDSLA